MATTVKTLKIFFSCPSDMDVHVNRARKIIADRNVTWERDFGIALRPLTFGEILSGYAPRGGQALINQQIFGEIDIYSGYMGHRFGSSTKDFGSGTEEEYRIALEFHNNNSGLRHILFGFSERPVNPFKIDLKQLKKVISFRKEMERSHLTYRWTSSNDFDKVFTSQIEHIVSKESKLVNKEDAVGASVLGGVRYK